MSHRPKHTIRLWLDLERSNSRDRDAENALAALFGLIPLANPSAAFLGRVVADVKRSRDLFSQRWVKIMIAASLAFLTLAMGMLPVSFMVLGKTLGLAALMELATRGLLVLGDGIVRGLTVWRGLAELGEAAAVLAATPMGIAALLFVSLFLGISVLIFRGLMSRLPEMSS